LHISRLVTGDPGVKDFDLAIGIKSTQIALQQPNVTSGVFSCLGDAVAHYHNFALASEYVLEFGGGVASDRDSLNMGIKE